MTDRISLDEARRGWADIILEKQRAERRRKIAMALSGVGVALSLAALAASLLWGRP